MPSYTKCLNSPNLFCFVCEQISPNKHRKNVTRLLNAYFKYFGINASEIRNEAWTFNFICFILRLCINKKFINNFLLIKSCFNNIKNLLTKFKFGFIYH